MNMIEQMEQNISYIMLGQALLLLVLFVSTVILFKKQRKLTKTYKAFMNGASGKNLEDVDRKSVV